MKRLARSCGSTLRELRRYDSAFHFTICVILKFWREKTHQTVAQEPDPSIISHFQYFLDYAEYCDEFNVVLGENNHFRQWNVRIQQHRRQ